MADYYPVLKRAISSLPSGSGEARRAVYEKARVALLRQLSSYNPPLSPTDIADQRVALEDCIRRVEAEVAGVADQASTGAEHAPAAPPPVKAPPPAAEEPTSHAAPEPRPEPRREEPAAPARKGGLASLAAPDMNPFRHIEPLAPPDMNPFRHIEPLSARGSAPARGEPSDRDAPRPPTSLPTERPRLPTARLPDEHGEPRIGVGVSALSRTLKQADSLGEASSTALRAARHAMSEVDEVDEPVAEKVEPGLGNARPSGSRQEPPALAASDKLAPERLQPQRETATLPWPEDGAGAGRRGRLLLIGLAVIVVVALGSAVFAYRDRLSGLIAGQPQTESNAATTGDDGLAPKILDRLPAEGETPAAPVAPDAVAVQTETVPAPAAVDPDLPPAPGAMAMAPSAPTQTAPPTDNGPVAAAPTAPAAAASTPAAAASPSETIGVAQRAILYEEPIPGAPGTKLEGRVVWAFVNEPALPGDKPVPQIRGDIEIPELGLKMRLSIHKNDDQALPASHIVEFSFDVPPAFPGKFIDAAPGMIAKQTEEARGDTITGAVAKVSDSLFWLALSGLEQDMTRNIQLLKDRPWIDIPIRYGNRRRAILTFEKGAPGEKVFAEAFAAWGE